MKGLLKYAFVLLVALGSASAPAAFWQWSRTAATNSQVDPSINWTGGMAPSAIDPSGRAMMARLAEYRDDISGALATAGTATAYTVTSHQLATGGTGNGICGAGTVPTDGQLIAVTPNNTNGAAPTLAVDTCTAAPIKSAPGVAVLAGTLISGSPYSLKYSVSNTGWMLREFFGNPYTVPLGSLTPYTGTTAPNSSFILPAGQCISTTTYAVYWALLGSPGVGACGAGTFAVIDLRGRLLAGSDNLNGSSAARMTTAGNGCGVSFNAIGSQCGNQGQTLTLAQLPGGIVVSNASQTITVTGPNNLTMYNGGGLTTVASAGGSSIPFPFGSQATGNSFAFSGNNALSMTSNNTSGSTHPNVQPTIAVTYLLRVI